LTSFISVDIIGSSALKFWTGNQNMGQYGCTTDSTGRLPLQLSSQVRQAKEIFLDL
jgi:hypothetical protein